MPGGWCDCGRSENPVAPGRGILAADESSGTIKKRFDAIGVETEFRKVMRYIIREDDPTSARMEIEQRYVNAAADWHTAVETTTAIACTAENFLVTATLRALDGGKEIFSRTWSESIKRDHV